MKFDPRIMNNSDLDPKEIFLDRLFLITVLFDKLNIDFTEEEIKQYELDKYFK